MTTKLDDIDRTILRILENDARTSLTDLAKRTDLSRNAVRQRIERMERQGIIAGYTIRYGDGRAPSSFITAFLFVTRHDRMRGGDVLAAIRQIPDVTLCHVLSGENDLLLRIDVLSQERVKAIWDQLSALSGVKDICTCFSLSQLIDKS